MSEKRQAAVAGTFYPADPAQLRQSVDEMLYTAGKNDALSRQKAIIAPHAGHVYSGPIAASLYASLDPERISRVILLGPSHQVGFSGIAACTASSYETPLGPIEIDTAAVESIQNLPNVGYLDDAHLKEHSLEVHLPFLQRILKGFRLVPLVVGDADKQDVARVIEKLWGEDETLIIISSDLSHFHNYEKAQQLDQQTSRKILDLDASLTGNEACGCKPINGLLHLAKQKHLKIDQIDVRNSGDTAGDRSRVVGYGAYAIIESQSDRATSKEIDSMDNDQTIPLAHRQQILQVARQAILHPLQSKENFQLNLDHFPSSLKADGASFITINLDGRLRGCIGSLQAHRALILDVANNAQAAAFKDPRFRPLTLKEYLEIELHASVLSAPEPVNVQTREELMQVIRPGKDGIILEEQGRLMASSMPSVFTPVASISPVRVVMSVPERIVQQYGQSQTDTYCDAC